MKLVYIHPATFPSTQASTVNVVKMCHAFLQNGHKVWLLGTGFFRLKQRNKELQDWYHTAKAFPTLWLPLLRVPGGERVFAWLCGLWSKVVGAEIVYGRKPTLLEPAALLGLKVMLELHVPLAQTGKRSVKAFEKLVAMGAVAQVVVISSALQTDFVQSYPKLAHLVTVAHDGADLPEMPVLPLLKPQARPRVGYAGHLYEGKGMELIAELVPLCPEADFLIIGGRDADVARWKETLRDVPNVTFYGFVPHAEVGGYVASCDVVLAPYLQKVTGVDGKTDLSVWMSPLKIFEYMALGKAMLASDLPVIREILRDGETAMLVPPGEPKKWATALKSLLADKASARRMGEAARQDIEDHFTWQKRAEIILG